MSIKQGYILPIRKNPSVILLKDSNFEFYMCGSRYFGGLTGDSDTDFWAQDSPATRTWLESNGFSLLEDELYDSPGETLAVYRSEENMVDVSLQKTMELTILVGQTIKRHISTYSSMSKESRNEVLVAMKAVVRNNWPL